MLLITGITGKSGKFLWKEIENHHQRFLENYHAIRLSVRNTSKVAFLHDSAIEPELYFGDLNDLDYINSLTNGVDVMLHIAGIHTSLPLVKAAIKNGVKWLILVHTTGIYSKYKAAGEEYRQIDSQIYQLAQDNNVNITILRPTMIYGELCDNNMIVFIKMVDRLKIMPVVNHADYALQPVHCHDLGEAYYQVLIHSDSTKNNDYNLSGKAPILLMDIFKEIAKNLGITKHYISVPFSVAYFGAWLLFLLTVRCIDFREKVQRLCEPRIFSHEKATQDFGYDPMSFADGIRQEVQEYKQII